jgi:hypothetical protein
VAASAANSSRPNAVPAIPQPPSAASVRSTQVLIAWLASPEILETICVAVGVGTTIVAIHGGWLAGFFLGTAVAGAGFGAGFQGAIRSVLSLTDAPERAGVLSVLYVIAYLAMGLPAVFAGVRVVHGGGILTTAREYGVAVIVLALLALGGALFRRRAQQAPSHPGSPAPSSDARPVCS